MKTLLLYADGSDLLLFIIGWAIVFIICVYITRWIYGINKIIKALQKQNDYSLIQVRLLKKMLINQGTPSDEVDEIIEKGNKEYWASNADIYKELDKDKETQQK